MKRAIRILITALVLMSVMTFFVAATGNNTYNYIINDTEYTVEFTDSNLSAEKQETIAQKLIGLNDSSAQTYGLGCTLFGHDYVYNTVNVVTHKVNTYVPRCKQNTYNVTSCEDCDYTEQTLIATSYIACCPED